MTLNEALLVVGLTTATSLGASSMALAHGPDGTMSNHGTWLWHGPRHDAATS